MMRKIGGSVSQVPGVTRKTLSRQVTERSSVELIQPRVKRLTRKSKSHVSDDEGNRWQVSQAQGVTRKAEVSRRRQATKPKSGNRDGEL